MLSIGCATSRSSTTMSSPKMVPGDHFFRLRHSGRLWRWSCAHTTSRPATSLHLPPRHRTTPTSASSASARLLRPCWMRRMRATAWRIWTLHRRFVWSARSAHAIGLCSGPSWLADPVSLRCFRPARCRARSEATLLAETVWAKPPVTGKCTIRQRIAQCIVLGSGAPGLGRFGSAPGAFSAKTCRGAPRVRQRPPPDPHSATSLV
mmetsp:Transcript_58680/g.115385  ORF Transcript_58680/g.115385 Transcript_58680/m.115385 type:complete len:206 (+) Transcript_58680:433-1050(+)